MLSSSSNTWSLVQSVRRVWAGAIAIGMSAVSVLPAAAYAWPQASAPESLGALPDGVYLYGQAPKPDQLGQGYFVFEVNQGTAVGALYMPRSSFDCATGKFQGNQLALTVVNSEDRSTNPFEIALEQTSTVASSGAPSLTQVGLQGFHRLPKLSEGDQRILGVCKADLQKQSPEQKSVSSAPEWLSANQF